MKIGIITQVRTTSTRLPSKVLLEINGKSLLSYHIDRLRDSGFEIFIATTTNRTDDIIETFCEENRLAFFRGSENDVLSRFYFLAKQEKLDVVVRVTSDCPLIDGYEIKNALNYYISLPDYENTYYSNVINRTFPRGFDFEILSFKMLEICFKNSLYDFEREHVTPYIWKSNPDQFNIRHYERSEDCSKYRLTVDEIDDFNLIKKLITDFSAQLINSNGIIELLKLHPEISLINSHIEQKKINK